jgi:hypothetical protein
MEREEHPSAEAQVAATRETGATSSKSVFISAMRQPGD